MADNTIVNLFDRERGRNAGRAPDPRRIDLAHESDIALGESVALPSRRLVRGPRGETTLEPKVMQVLVALARQPGTILSRDDLIERCWDGRIVGDASINRVLSLLRAALRETAGDGVSVETVPRVGYRLLVDGEVSPIAADEANVAPTAFAPARNKKFTRYWPAAAAVLVAVLAAAAWFLRPVTAPGEIGIAMMPVQAGEGIDPIFAAGFESELRKELARSEGVRVTASETAGLLGADTPDYPAIARALDAGRLWTGTIEREDGRLVLTTSLLDERGRTVWNDVLRGDAEQAAALPVRAARMMLRELGRTPGAQRALEQISAEEYELYVFGQGLIRSRDPGQVQAAEKIFEGFTARHPDLSEGWSALAKALMLSVNLDADDPIRRADLARRHAARALELDPDSVEALKVGGMLALDSKTRFERMDNAVALDPGDSEAWLWLSHVSAHPDYTSREAEAMEQLVLLDPLWGLSWQAGHIIAQEKGVEAARPADLSIASAAAEPWQADLARARIANREGDVSQFYTAALAAMPAMTPGQRSITGLQLNNMALLVGMDIPRPRPPGVGGLIQDTVNGKLPSRGALAAEGLDGPDYFEVVPLIIGGPSLYIDADREDELIANFEAKFATPQDLPAFAEKNLRPFHYQTNVATYLGFAYRKAGRERQARELFEIADRAVARWRAGDAMNLTPLLFEANLAAAMGQDRRAIDALEKAIALGYPYVIQSPGVALTGPLLDDPVWMGCASIPKWWRCSRRSGPISQGNDTRSWPLRPFDNPRAIGSAGIPERLAGLASDRRTARNSNKKSLSYKRRACQTSMRVRCVGFARFEAPPVSPSGAEAVVPHDAGVPP